MADSPSPIFAQVTVLAPGLLGASVLMAAKAHGLTSRTAVWARREETRRQCAEQPWCDAVYPTPQDAVAQADLVVICSPVEHIVPLLWQIAPHLKQGAIVTDVGSTKKRICEAAAQVELPKGCAFIGSHPMAGSEKTGLAHGRADLFKGRPCLVIAPADDHAPRGGIDAYKERISKIVGNASIQPAAGQRLPSQPANKQAAHTAFEKVCAFWQSLGMRVLTPDAATHDRLVAEVSHLPHLLASTLSAWLDRDSEADARRDASGSGLRDTTRIAAGDPNLWLSIFRENREEVVRALADYIAAAQSALELLENDQADSDAELLNLLECGKQARDKLDQTK